jgi:mannose/fructose/N-acetylgalactosamine-specific phosphotransferase system component IID
MTEGDYRDELAAAHARIAELQQELADARAGGVNAAPWLRELEAKRAAVIAESKAGLGDPARRWKVRGIIFGVAFAVGAMLSLVLGTWIPFMPLFGFALHPGMLIVWSMGRARQQKTTLELAKLDEKIADVKRMASMMGAAHVRVAAAPRVAVDAPEALEAEDAASYARRRT